MMKHKKFSAAVLSLAVIANAVPAVAFAEEAMSNDFSGYVLMNIPYSEFYTAENAEIGDVDAVSSATNKTGNYGKTGGAYHSGTTAEIAEDGTVTAVGGANGSQVKGVTWAVKADSLEAVKALGGTEITDDSTVTTATLGRGQTSSNVLVGYEALTESPAYSYYVLDSVPENYLVLDGTTFKAGNDTVTSSAEIEVPISYGTNRGDIQLDVAGATDTSDKIINAMVITAEDGTTKGLYHLDQIWAFNEIAWNVAVTPELDGKAITNIRYYCTVKDGDLSDSQAPAYVNYIYDYNINVDVVQVYRGEVSATFEDANTISLKGLPEDIQNLTAKVYYTTGGRNAEYTYLTPLVVDSADDDIDPTFVDVTNGKIAIEAGSVTNKAGTTQTFGEPVDGTTYTIEFSADNYIIGKITTEYTAPAGTEVKDGYIYGTMEIPYSEFFKAEFADAKNSDVEVDAVSSATTSKWKMNQTGSVGEDGTWTNGGLVAGTFYAEGENGGGQILGVVYPVAITQADLDALGENNYNFTALETEPTAYKKVTVSNGTAFFSELVDTDGAVEVGGAVTLQTQTKYGDYQLKVENAPKDADTYGAIVKTTDGNYYALRALENIWRNGEYVWSVGYVTETHGNNTDNPDYYSSNGATIDSFTIITLDGYRTISNLNLYLPEIFTAGVEVENGNSGTGSVTADISAFPTDYAISATVEEGFTVDGGTIAYENAQPKSYTVTYSDTNGKYADVKGTFVLSTAEIPVVYNNGKLVAAEGYTEEDVTNFIANITSVKVGENAYNTGRRGTTIVKADGTIDTEVASNGNAVFAESGTYSLSITATGYENTYDFDFEAEVTPQETTTETTTTETTTTTATETTATTATENATTATTATTPTETTATKEDGENLPETGNNSLKTVGGAFIAFLLTGIGAGAMLNSGMLRKKEEEE